MNLPHKEPILFAKKVLSNDDFTAQVECCFDLIPTFGMCIEACAQASSSLKDGKTEGFLASISNVERLKELDKKIYIATIKQLYEIENMKLFYFELEDYMKGKFAIYAK